jgi:hypothetical protein
VALLASAAQRVRQAQRVRRLALASLVLASLVLARALRAQAARVRELQAWGP